MSLTTGSSLSDFWCHPPSCLCVQEGTRGQTNCSKSGSPRENNHRCIPSMWPSDTTPDQPLSHCCEAIWFPPQGCLSPRCVQLLPLVAMTPIPSLRPGVPVARWNSPNTVEGALGLDGVRLGAPAANSLWRVTTIWFPPSVLNHTWTMPRGKLSRGKKKKRSLSVTWWPTIGHINGVLSQTSSQPGHLRCWCNYKVHTKTMT